ncbi:hypothetical protein PFAG_05297 [Plasmodium falciparum Santa Lucia]|uniref:Uncharacterized protein n=2 Tax=Plasmodium falciparum TaxID=5833 RepID=A0A024X1R7_PLAFC|nr:hypothetical protein PFMC_05193 [Plasmodium falciparum CAMP/Malaysia]EUT78719.1 hypothetical protein PFAG_05297 [Plasmodium falciparum Santa Lucia]
MIHLCIRRNFLYLTKNNNKKKEQHIFNIYIYIIHIYMGLCEIITSFYYSMENTELITYLKVGGIYPTSFIHK